jgi:hypothetical protein
MREKKDLNFSIRDVLIDENDVFKEVTKLQMQRIIELCHRDIGEFKNCIDIMLHQYSYINFNNSKIENHRLSTDVDNLSIIKLQKKISLCINILLNFPAPSTSKELYLHTFSAAATALQQFWYDEGYQLGLDFWSNSINSKESFDFQQNHLYISAVLGFLTDDFDGSLTSKICYKSLLKILSKSDSFESDDSFAQFSLEKLAKETPEQFKLLYEYFFSERQEFKKLADNKRGFAHFNYALFHYYASVAGESYGKKNYNPEKEPTSLFHPKINKTMAFNILSRSSSSGFLKGEQLLMRVFEEDPVANINAHMKLGILYLKSDNEKKHSVNKDIFKQIKSYNLSDFNKLTICPSQLLYYWITKLDDNNIVQFATNWITILAIRADNLARIYLKRLASSHSDFAILHAKLCLQSSGNLEAQSKALNILLNHPEKNGELYYYAYCLQIKTRSEHALETLLCAAEGGYDRAINQLTAICKNSVFRNHTFRIIINSLNSETLFLFNFLKNCYLSGTFLPSAFEEEPALTDQLNLFFYPCLDGNDPDKSLESVETSANNSPLTGRFNLFKPAADKEFKTEDESLCIIYQ